MSYKGKKYRKISNNFTSACSDSAVGVHLNLKGHKTVSKVASYHHPGIEGSIWGRIFSKSESNNNLITMS